MQFLFNSLMFTTLLTKKHDQVALLIDSAFTWSSLKGKYASSKMKFRTHSLSVNAYLIILSKNEKK